MFTPSLVWHLFFF